MMIIKVNEIAGKSIPDVMLEIGETSKFREIADRVSKATGVPIDDTLESMAFQIKVKKQDFIWEE